VAGPDAVGEGVGDELEEAVSGGVPERVVDLLEAVEVEQEQAGAVARGLGLAARLPEPGAGAVPPGAAPAAVLAAPLGAPRAGEGLLRPDDEELAVRQAGEPVVQGLVLAPHGHGGVEVDGDERQDD